MILNTFMISTKLKKLQTFAIILNMRTQFLDGFEIFSVCLDHCHLIFLKKTLRQQKHIIVLKYYCKELDSETFF